MQHKADTSYHINAKRIMDKLISAAQKNGYKNSDAACKVFARNVFDEFSIKTAYEICDILPIDEATRILADEGAPLRFLERGHDER